MTGRTNYTAPTNASAMQGPSQMTDIYAHFDPLIGETVANAAALPSSGNWVGRTTTALDTGALYLCTALPGTWVVVREDTGWITPTLAGGWTVDSGQTVQYRRLTRVVFLRGRLTGGTTNPFTLPVGFRPSQALLLSVLSGAASPPVNARVVVNPDGTFALIAGTQPNFDSIRFPADV